MVANALCTALPDSLCSSVGYSTFGLTQPRLICIHSFFRATQTPDNSDTVTARCMFPYPAVARLQRHIEYEYSQGKWVTVK
jgi:hypothetical protein